MKRKVRASLVKLVAFTAMSVLLTSIVLATLLNLDVRPQYGYYADFANASGLEPGDSVDMAGVQVGKVNAITLVGRRARVAFSVDKTQHMTTTDLAAIRYANLLGQRFLAVMPGRKGGRPLRPGSVIQPPRTIGGLDLTEVFDGFQPLFSALSPGEVNQLTASIVQIFEGQAGTVENLLAETATFTTNLADQQTVVNQVLDNLAPLLNVVGTRDSQIAQLVDNFDAVVKGLAASSSQLAGTIDGASVLTNKFSALLQQSQPALNNDIAQLATTSQVLAAQQAGIDGVIQGLPGVFNTADKILSSGNYLGVYVCDLTVNLLPVVSASANTAGPINISIIPGVPAPQYPDPLYLPASSTAGGAAHTATCR